MAAVTSRGESWRSIWFFRVLLWMALACLLLVAVFVGLIVFGLGPMSDRSHPELPPPMSRDRFEVQFEALEWPSLPAEAKDVRYAHNSGLDGSMTLFRCEAPAKDCIAFGKAFLEEHHGSAKLVPITSPPETVKKSTLEACGLGSVDWFDPETIETGVEGHEDPPEYPRFSIWIDTVRGRFYYFSAD